MNDEQLYSINNPHTAILKKLYINKCNQIKKAMLSSNHFRCQVLKAEAAAIRAELSKE